MKPGDILYADNPQPRGTYQIVRLTAKRVMVRRVATTVHRVEGYYHWFSVQRDELDGPEVKLIRRDETTARNARSRYSYMNDLYRVSANPGGVFMGSSGFNMGRGVDGPDLSDLRQMGMAHPWDERELEALSSRRGEVAS